MNAPVLALISGKGGVAKSTLALALADTFASARERVALVDMDPQAGATLAAGLSRPESPLTDPGVLVHGFTLFRSSRGLSEATASALVRRLESARDGAGMVVVDLSPALTDAGHAEVLDVATLIVVCARCDAAGLPNVAEAVRLAQSAGVPFVVVPTFKGTTGLAREAEAFLRGRYSDAVTRATIPTDAKAAESVGAGKPVTQTAKRAKVSEAVRTLATELGARLHVRA